MDRERRPPFRDDSVTGMHAYDPQANEILEKIFAMDQYAARFMLIQKLKRHP